MRPAYRISVMVAALAAALGAQGASAQYYDDGYDRPPPRRIYDEPYERPAPRRVATGLNCDAVQSGLTGFKPYSCPLPGPRPLGVRCYCNMPIAPLSGPQTAVGRVVP
jgi:hypothetical protein